MMFLAVKWLLQHASTLTPTQKLVLVTLYSLANPDGVFFPSQLYLGKVTGLSPRAVRKALKDLSDLSMIKRKHRRLGDAPTSDLITIQWPIEVAEKRQSPPRATNRHDDPVPSGTKCRQTDRTQHTRHLRDRRLDEFESLERMPEPHAPYPMPNRIGHLVADLHKSSAAIDWAAPGIQNVKVLESWLRQYNFSFILAVFLETCGKHQMSKCSNETIKSWQYFKYEVERQANFHSQSASHDTDGAWRHKAERFMQHSNKIRSPRTERKRT